MRIELNLYGLDTILQTVSNVLLEAERVTDSEAKNFNIRYALGAIDAIRYMVEVVEEDDDDDDGDDEDLVAKLNDWAKSSKIPTFKPPAQVNTTITKDKGSFF